MEKGKVLDEAKKIINGERNGQYGDPEDSLEAIALSWTSYLQGYANVTLTGKDAALMMVLLKICREQHSEKRDNLVDAAGYLGIAGDF